MGYFGGVGVFVGCVTGYGYLASSIRVFFLLEISSTVSITGTAIIVTVVMIAERAERMLDARSWMLMEV